MGRGPAGRQRAARRHGVRRRRHRAHCAERGVGLVGIAAGRGQSGGARGAAAHPRAAVRGALRRSAEADLRNDGVPGAGLGLGQRRQHSIRVVSDAGRSEVAPAGRRRGRDTGRLSARAEPGHRDRDHVVRVRWRAPHARGAREPARSIPGRALDRRSARRAVVRGRAVPDRARDHGGDQRRRGHGGGRAGDGGRDTRRARGRRSAFRGPRARTGHGSVGVGDVVGKPPGDSRRGRGDVAAHGRDQLRPHGAAVVPERRSACAQRRPARARGGAPIHRAARRSRCRPPAAVPAGPPGSGWARPACDSHRPANRGGGGRRQSIRISLRPTLPLAATC